MLKISTKTLPHLRLSNIARAGRKASEKKRRKVDLNTKFTFKKIQVLHRDVRRTIEMWGGFEAMKGKKTRKRELKNSSRRKKSLLNINNKCEWIPWAHTYNFLEWILFPAFLSFIALKCSSRSLARTLFTVYVNVRILLLWH